ncbi:Signal transduction histidine-protein kinase/phosphatase MprB OS=Streptomyces microflavus OX=1919 GN=G3I39_35185 PE=4 SV=1 [Streptomyces microflavus]
MALLAIISAVLLAVRQANRLASPYAASPTPPNASAPATPARATSGTGVPELDRVADVLDYSAERIAGC